MDSIDKEKLLDILFKLSRQALDVAISEIKKKSSFSPFAGIYTTDDELQMIVYVDPDNENIEQEEHASIIQDILIERYGEDTCLSAFMAFDGILMDDNNAIYIRVSSKELSIHKIFIYHYSIKNGAVIISEDIQVRSIFYQQ